MTFFALSVLAGLLTVFAPCILPLLPVVVGAAGTAGARGGRRALTVIGALSVSVIIFTLLLKASTLLIDIPPQTWAFISGTVLVLLGIFILFPMAWVRIPFLGTLQSRANTVVGSGHYKDSVMGDVIAGLALGPVFTTCSPTYLFILATVLPASFSVGMVYLLGFVFGMAVALGAVALLGNKLVNRLHLSEARMARIERVFGILIILVGSAIITGADKRIETALLNMGIGGTVLFEQRLIDSVKEEVTPKEVRETKDRGAGEKGVSVVVPDFLRQHFPNTRWEGADPSLANLLSGGPGKDGIPAIDTPTFVPLSSVSISGEVEAIVLFDGARVKVYPYNILVWHEIVNDTLDGVPVAVTFCPLCGSAVVYEGRVRGSAVTFGVSGALIESNMVMYDRETESLWQQSTGKALAGAYVGERLSLAPFQRMTIAEVRTRYPDAVLLSEQTGYSRDYTRNPYSGYEESDSFVFAPSSFNTRYPGKEMMVVFRAGAQSVAVPWASLQEGISYDATFSSDAYTLVRNQGTLSIVDATGVMVPFYFEMWFSFAVQHGEEGVVFDPSDNTHL